MKYYVGIEADEVAAELWALDRAAGNTFGNNRPLEGKAEEVAETEAAERTPSEKTS